MGAQPSRNILAETPIQAHWELNPGILNHTPVLSPLEHSLSEVACPKNFGGGDETFKNPIGWCLHTPFAKIFPRRPCPAVHPALLPRKKMNPQTQFEI